jgi:hypothetical protein
MAGEKDNREDPGQKDLNTQSHCGDDKENQEIDL